MWMIFHKPSPVGMLTLSSDGTALTGLWLDGQKYFGAGLPNAVKAVSYTHLTLPTIA